MTEIVAPKPPFQANLDLRRRNDFIQYLRGFAALMVVLDHSILRLCKADPSYGWLATYAGDLGAMGVQIFFVISGYIMVAISHDAFGVHGATVKFWKARIARIAPLYYIATLMILLLPQHYGGREFSVSDIIKSFLFIATDARPDDQALRPVLGVGWTLNYEMFFYLIFGLCLVFKRAFGVFTTVASLTVLIAIGRYLSHVGAAPERSIQFFYTNHLMILFAAGMALALWQRSEYFRLVHIPAPATIGISLPLAAIIALNMRMPGHYPLWRTFLLYGLAVASVALCIAAKPKPRQRFFEMIGDASFSIYLFHGFSLIVVIALWNAYIGNSLPLLRILVCLIAGGAAGVAAYRWLEQPIVRMLKPKSRQAREG